MWYWRGARDEMNSRGSTSSEPPGRSDTDGGLGSAQVWLATTKLGLVVMALVVGAVAGLGAAAFRDLIYLFTWLFTGHSAYGQYGHRPSCICRSSESGLS